MHASAVCRGLAVAVVSATLGAVPTISHADEPAPVASATPVDPAGGLQSAIAHLGASPAAAQVDAIVAQVNTVLAATPPAGLDALDGVLTRFAPLLKTAGLDPAGLRTLFGQVAVIHQLPDAPPAITTIITVLVTGSTTPPPATPATFSAYRVTVVRAKRSADGRHAYVVLRCPASVDGAIADLRGTVGKRAAFAPRRVALLGDATKVVTLRIRDGKGPLKIVATTRGSSLAPSARRAIR